MNEFLQQIINGLTVGAIYALIALGYTMIYGVLRFINFAHGDVFMVGAYIGLYVYRRTFLLEFARLPQTPLERLEQLEQLRALEHGFRIKVVPTQYVSIGVDTPEDVVKVEHLLRGET